MNRSERYIKNEAGEFTPIAKRHTPQRRNMNSWVFANLGTNISDQVWEIGQAYKQATTTPPGEKLRRHHHSHPIQLLKFFYFVYLTGSRISEPTAGGAEAPTVDLFNEKGVAWVEVNKVNSKHKSPDGIGRQMISQLFPVFNVSEQKMWNFITDGGLQTNVREMFQFADWKSLKHENLNCLFKTNFRTDLKDPSGNLSKDTGITPHILRHMRTFNVLINYGVDRSLVKDWFGWKNTRMIDYYALERTRLERKLQREILERGQHFTNLAVDMGKAMAPY